ncbi:MAG: AAA domain-containing protein, partial [Chloroflexota bacterium]
MSPNVRSMLTAWMKIYGETNDVPGLVSGPIEVRFRRLREHTGADVFLLWTTPEHWAGGEALSLWIPAIGLALECRVEKERLVVEKARPIGEEERDPRRQRSAIGMELRPDGVELPPPDQEGENPSAGLVNAFERLLDRRWTSFVDPLREALEAEARDDASRAERLATPYAAATPRIGSPSESDPYRLSGVEASAVAGFDEGEWLDLVDTRGRVISSARLVRIDPAEGTMDIDVRGADPPSEGIVRPRPQTQILAQKRAILEELDNPTGGLANAVRLVASPASLPPPTRHRPASFVNRLVAQNRSQVRAVSLALGLDEGQALMVQGPPGTGKSTTLAEILGQLVTRDQNVTVLVCSHSNHGVDNLLLKTLPYLETVPELTIARVGLFERVHPLARPHYQPPGEDLGAFNVVFATVDALALQVEAGGRTYDYAVLDEANRASILDSLIPLVRGRRFILVGDHLQLQPVLSEAEEQLRLEPAVGNTSAIGKSLFAWLRERRFPEAATVFLDEQNRMHPLIAGLISEVFYEGKLRSGRRAPRRVADVPLFPAAVTWVDTRGLHGLREARGRGASLVNVPEARLVATIARHILGSSQKEVEVGVISAYAEQTALLRRLLLHRNNQRQGANANGKSAGLDRAALKLLEIDTVDAFEGREKDIIIVSLVRSNRRRDIGFLRLMQRINVALSRAKTMLIVVGDTSTLRGSYFDRIVRYVRANGMLVPGPRLIGRLLNARNNERAGGERLVGAGERAAGAGRRRRPLPSARTAFPLQDPAATAQGAGEAGGEAAEGQPSRRRRRRVRGRAGQGQSGQDQPGQDRRPIQPTTTMEMTPANEPGPDEPATQYEIDRFAALVEQLLGDTSSDEAAGGTESAGAPEVDRAHAEEVLADALRAVGEQAERGGPSRSRRNNRRRSRRGQGRPLPGDAAVADAARRMAREELLAGDAAGAQTDSQQSAPPAEYPGSEPDRIAAADLSDGTPPSVAPPGAHRGAAFRPFDVLAGPPVHPTADAPSAARPVMRDPFRPSPLTPVAPSPAAEHREAPGGQPAEARPLQPAGAPEERA